MHLPLLQTEATLGPCAINPVHVHPRSSELTYVVFGSVETGIIEENGGGNVAVLRNASAGSTITFPQGLLHWCAPGCSWAREASGATCK